MSSPALDPLAMVSSAAVEVLHRRVPNIGNVVEFLGKGMAGTLLHRDALDEAVEQAPVSVGPESSTYLPPGVRSVLTDSPAVIGALLALDADAVFAEARRRVRLVFRISMAVSTALALLLLSAVAAALVFAFLGRTTWALAFGGVSAADVVTVWVSKPLGEMQAASLAAQRLDFLTLSARERLRGCQAHQAFHDRIDCCSRVWEALRSELGGVQGPRVPLSFEIRDDVPLR